MAEATLEKKTGRLDLRMTPEQKRQIEMASRIDGISVSQWSVSCLVESARNVIADQAAMRLSEQSFEEFAALLDEAPSRRFVEFQEGGTRWD